MVRWFEFILWFAMVGFGLVMAGLGAGLETGFYCLNRLRLHVHQHRSDNSARLLAKYVAAPTALIASLLIVHNAGVKLSTHGVAVLLSGYDMTPWKLVVFDALIMMPVLFVFAETLPKDLFAVHADRLVYWFARPMAWQVEACRYSGLLGLIEGTSRLLMKMLGVGGHVETFHPRYQVQMLVKEGVGSGLLSDEQLAIVDRVFLLGRRRVAEVMTPWEKVIKVKIDDAPNTLWNLAERTNRTRFPVVDGEGKVRGVVNVFDALVHDPEQCPSIESIMGGVANFDDQLPLRDALTRLQQRRDALAIVGEPETGPVGIVTIQDLIEPITGELTNW